VATALRFTGPVEGVTFVVPGPKSPFGVMDCRLALTLSELASVLREHGVVAVRVDNMYRRRAHLPRSRKRSQHAHALAIDIMAFELEGGQTLDVEDDWHGQRGQPSCGPEASLVLSTNAAIRLRNVVCDIARHGLFHTILTPNYDAAHRNHLHMDIKRDAVRAILR
jgi:hypothetical protein